jgi:hypothetical protein
MPACKNQNESLLSDQKMNLSPIPLRALNQLTSSRQYVHLSDAITRWRGFFCHLSPELPLGATHISPLRGFGFRNVMTEVNSSNVERGFEGFLPGVSMPF